MNVEAFAYAGPARELSDGERTAVTVVAAAVGVLGVLGFVNSFAAVQAAARPSFGSLAWTVPLAIDVGILVFSALDIVLARLDMRPRWVRLVPWSLIAATIYLNVADQPTWFGRTAHAVLPALWVVAVEVGTHAVRVRAGLASATRMDRIRTPRWLLAPLATVLLWRRMVLWEERSYTAALDRERTRLLALTHLQDTYGRWAWHWRAPRRARALYKLGELAPGTVSFPQPLTDTAALAVLPNGGPPANASTTKRTGRGRTVRRSAPDVEDLMPLGRRVAVELVQAGVPLNRQSLAAELRKRGRSVSNARAGALLARLRTETTPDLPVEGVHR